MLTQTLLVVLFVVAAQAGCPANYNHEYAGKCYRLTDVMNRADAESDCESDGKLATIGSATVRDYVRGLPDFITGDTYIDVMGVGSAPVVWLNSFGIPATYLPWLRGTAPTFAGCVFMRTDGFFNAVPCSVTREALCESNAIP